MTGTAVVPETLSSLMDRAIALEIKEIVNRVIPEEYRTTHRVPSKAMWEMAELFCKEAGINFAEAKDNHIRGWVVQHS